MNKITFPEWRAKRAKDLANYPLIPALQSFRMIKGEKGFADWKQSVGLHGKIYDTHAFSYEGFHVVFTLEPDSDYSDDFERAWHEDSGRYGLNSREKGEFNRHEGQGLSVERDKWESCGDMRADYRVYHISEPELRQFRDKRLGRHKSYVNMIKRAKSVLDSELSLNAFNYYGCVCEIFSCEEDAESGRRDRADLIWGRASVWGFDEAYAESGYPFYEGIFQEALGEAKEARAKQNEQFARDYEATRPDMYQGAL